MFNHLAPKSCRSETFQLLGMMAALVAFASELRAGSDDSQGANEKGGAEISDQQAPTDNTRMRTLDGSASPWSGQFNLTYLGSSLDHPLSKLAPNPGDVVPPPVVTLSGTFSTRYRIDGRTTVGVGTGITTETPFQGPKNTTLADPYVDVARTSNWGGIHNRLDLQLTQWTNHQYFTNYGYRNGVTLSNESLHQFDSGFTAGLYLLASGNTFAAGDYNRTQQNLYSFAYDPFFEYAFSKTFNLRTIIGIIDSKNRADSGTSFQHPGVYQTVGLGIAASDAVYIYTFVKAYPYAVAPVTNQNTVVGVSAIVNLF